MHVSAPSLLIVDDDVGFVDCAAGIARGQGFNITVAGELRQARNRIHECDYDLALVDIALPGGGLALLDGVDHERTQAIAIAETPMSESMLHSLRRADIDCLVKPIAPEKLQVLMETCASRRKRESGAVRQWHGMVGASAQFRDVVDMIKRVAPGDIAVLVHGESGSGKELVARAIHDAGGRSGPFVAVNCGAIAPELLSSQLFGHEKGSFTGAFARHRGYLERAANGTLFLDEVSEMPLALQTHLLRVLDYGSYHRVGGDQDLPVAARIVSATNRDPLCAVSAGLLREDLYYRLCGFDIAVPPLRDRGDDVLLLADAFLDEFNAAAGTGHAFDAGAAKALRRSPWPGNVRELRNAVKRAHILADGGIVRIPPAALPQRALQETDSTITFAVGTSLEEMERHVLQKTLRHFGNNRSRAAAALGITPRTIRNRLARDRGRRDPR
jgi:DNA-binding NtrC family response regulator